MTGVKLPGWVVDNKTSVLREAAPYKTMTSEERLRRMMMACEDAIIQLNAREDREAILSFRDPLPPDSVAALARLRALASKRRRDDS